jgi:hypothetical protein
MWSCPRNPCSEHYAKVKQIQKNCKLIFVREYFYGDNRMAVYNSEDIGARALTHLNRVYYYEKDLDEVRNI